jgi:2-amino-4-hydroxy-6-hydroxymethyldihydropteridine diphosphokinase
MPDPRGPRYAIGVGANLGDRAATIADAARRLAATGDVRLVAQATLIETAPVGGPGGQGGYLNGAWVVETALGPHQLLAVLQRLETACGRTRAVRWGPRTLDLDLLLADDGRVVASGVLQLPHPRLLERPFVLVPLAEIAGGWPLPGSGTTVAGHLRATG